MSMHKSKPEFRRMPQAQQYYDLEKTIGVASRKKYLEDMKLRIEEAENRGRNIRLRNDWLQHQKKSLYQGELDDVNRQLERPMMPVRTKEELFKKQKELKDIVAEIILYLIYDYISEQGDPNRLPIEQVIDRRATLFRNKQFGSQFDNLDFLGLKKQEDDKVKNEMRQTQLRQTAIATGSSMGVLSYGGLTPVGAYNADGFETPDSDDYRMTAEQISRIRAELEAGERRQREAQQASSSSARSDLSDATSQSLPAGIPIHSSGIPIHSMATDEEEDEEMPPLETPTEVAEEEEDDDEEETEVSTKRRKHRETIDHNEDISRWRQNDVTTNDILFQLHLRGIQLTEEQEEEMAKLKTEGKGKTPTKKDYLLNYVERLIQTGKWADEVNDQLLKSRMEDWKQMKKGKGKGVIRKAFESTGSALLDAGKEVAKDALIAGAQSAVMSLL